MRHVLGHSVFMGGGIVLLMPLLYLLVGLAFIAVATRDRRGTPDRSVPRLPTKRHPLHHVRVAMNAPRAQAQAAARKAAREADRKPRSRPRWLTPV
jgi:hypothetical protein